MARVKTSALISDISGKINGSVFQRNQGGLILRNQGGKINSNTLRSNGHKVGMAGIQVDWQNLSDADRLLWQTYALYLNKKQVKNNSLNINGHQLFINVNSIRYDLSFYNALFQPYLLSTPVLAPLPLPINITSIERDGLDLNCNLDRVISNVDDVIICYLSRPLLPSQQSANQKLTLMKASTNSGSLFECNAYYVSVYGRVLEVGEWVQSKIAIYNTASENYSAFSVNRFQVV